MYKGPLTHSLLCSKFAELTLTTIKDKAVKEKGLTCSWVLKIIVLRSNYICLSSFTALLRLKRKSHDICYLLGNPLKYAFIANKYRYCACHSLDNFIPAIRYLYLCHEYAAFCRL